MARRLNTTIWVTILMVAAIDIAAAASGEFRISWESLIKPSTVCSMLVLGGWFYRRFRPDPSLAAALGATAQIVAFAAVAAPLSYIAASAAFPLRDAMLAQWDHALGLDWVGLLSFLTAHSWLRTALLCAYSSFLPQTICVVLALSFTGQPARLVAFVGAFAATGLITIVISMICPAEGAWMFYGIDANIAGSYPPLSHTSWPVFLGLRDGSFNRLSGLGSEGIITFPSLHAALGVVFACALWTVPRLRIIALVLNAAMIAATPIEGSHYFADVIVGTGIALVCWLALLRAVTTTGVASGEIIPTADAPALVPSVSGLDARELMHEQPTDASVMHRVN